MDSIENLQATYEKLVKNLNLSKISSEKLFDIRLTVYELCSNVIKHSRCSCEVSANLDGNDISITINSQKPFDIIEKSPMPHCESGRGVWLVREIVNSLQYKDDGRVIVAKIKIE